MKNKKQKAFSPRAAWRKLYKTVLNTGAYFPIAYSILYLSTLKIAMPDFHKKNVYMFFFWVGFVFSILAMSEIFRKNFKPVKQNKKSPPPIKKAVTKKPAPDYPKLIYPGGKELNVEYEDRVDYYRFEDGKFLYCGSVKKENQRQIR